MQTWKFHLRQLSSVVMINYANKDRMNYWLHAYWSRIKGCVGNVLEVETHDEGRGKGNFWVWSLVQVYRKVTLVHCCLTALAKKPRSVNTGVRFLPIAWWIPGKFHCWTPDTKNITAFDKFEGTRLPEQGCVWVYTHEICWQLWETLKFVDYKPYDS